VQTRQVIRLAPALLALLAALAYLGWVLAKSGGDPLEFAKLGTRYSQPLPAGTEGYDGQFAYFIAVDPIPADVAPHLDIPAYRYQRILYPILARIFAFGNLSLIAWTLPILNLLIFFCLVWQTGILLADRGGSVLPALLVGLWAGVLGSVRLDLAEPLALLLVVLAWRAAGLNLDRHAPLVALLLAMSLFAKETTMVFLAGFLLWSLIQKRWAHALLFALAAAPFTLFQIWLWSVFGAPGIGSGGAGGTPFEWIPFAGLVSISDVSLTVFIVMTIVYLPGLLLPCVYAMAKPIADGIKRRLTPEAAFLFLQALMVSLAPFSTFREPLGILRLACGLMLCLHAYAARASIRWWTKASLVGLAYLAFIAG
jgi:hypothetical protein